MELLKEEILDHAKSDWRKDYNKEILAVKQRERQIRDQEIRKKEREENLAKGGDGNVDDPDREVGETGWGKGGIRQTGAPNSPPKRDREGGMGGGFNITRSDKPRNTNTDEEKKSERPSFTRGPKREDAPDTGFVRGNFAKKTEVEAKKDDSPKKTFDRPARAAPTEGGSGFGGFRNNNTARKGPPKK
jgi:hypothetical protein